MAVRIEQLLWNGNTEHVTRRATVTEVEEVFLSRPVIRGNLRGRAGTHVAIGQTAAGRRLAIPFVYDPDERAARPITVWERK